MRQPGSEDAHLKLVIYFLALTLACSLFFCFLKYMATRTSREVPYEELPGGKWYLADDFGPDISLPSPSSSFSEIGLSS